MQAFLLPATVDAYAITATRVWLSRHTRSTRLRRFAGLNAIGAIGLSLAGNAVYHFIAASPIHQAIQLGQQALDWRLVVLVSAVPPIAIGLISHLAVLRSRDTEYADAEQRASAHRSADRGEPTEFPDRGREVVHGESREGRLDQGASPGPGRRSTTADRSTGRHHACASRTGAEKDRQTSRAKPPRRTAEDHARDQEAMKVYLDSVAAGEPLSERKLAARFGLTSRRWTRKAMAQATAADDRQSRARAQPAAADAAA